MKLISILITIVTINLYANENWIKIEPITDTQTAKTQKPETKLDFNLSQFGSSSKIMKNINLIQQVMKATSKKEIKKQTPNDKNWFVISEVAK